MKHRLSGAPQLRRLGTAFCFAVLYAVGLFTLRAQAQQLDLGSHPASARTGRTHPIERYRPPSFVRHAPGHSSPLKGSPPPTMTHSTTSPPPAGPPPTAESSSSSGTSTLSATVTHTLYLPPAMYGEWNVSGRLIETNAPDLFSPNSNDIWLLEREGDDITVTNPTNGARASIRVDRAEGDKATFHRSGTAGKHAIYQEIPTITVFGDNFSGQSLNKLQEIKNGQVVSEVYGVYHLEATRINAARTRFRPEAEQAEPDLQIDEIHR